MGIYLADQAIVFLQSILVGAALGLLYDFFRVSRVAFPTSAGVIFAEDVIFFAACAVVTFFFGLAAIDGTLRLFLLLGELLGAVLYYYTAGKVVMGLSKKIIDTIKAFCRFTFRWILHPIWRAFYRTTTLIIAPFKIFSKFFKKNLQKANFCLKVRRKVLYNQLAGCFTARHPVKNRKEHKHEKPKRKRQKEQKRQKKP